MIHWKKKELIEYFQQLELSIKNFDERLDDQARNMSKYVPVVHSHWKQYQVLDGNGGYDRLENAVNAIRAFGDNKFYTAVLTRIRENAVSKNDVGLGSMYSTFVEKDKQERRRIGREFSDGFDADFLLDICWRKVLLYLRLKFKQS